MSKSHVSMETRMCIVCGEEYDTGSILLDRRLKNSLEEKTMTGMGMCPSHEKMKDEGYIALVGVEKECANPIRTGEVFHVRASVWAEVFNIPLPPAGVALAPKEVMTALMEMIDVAPANKNHES